MNNEKTCPKCGNERIEWSFEEHAGQSFCRTCVVLTVTLPWSAYELYAGRVISRSNQEKTALLRVAYPHQDAGKNIEVTIQGEAGEISNWTKGSVKLEGDSPLTAPSSFTMSKTWSLERIFSWNKSI